MSTGAATVSQVAQWVKDPPGVQETQEMWVQSLGREDPLGDDMATHSSILAAESMDRGTWSATIHRVTHDLSNWVCMHTDTVNNSMEVPQRIKNKTILWSSNSIYGYMPKIIKSRDLNKYLCTNAHSFPGGSGILLVKNPIHLQCRTHLGSIPGLRRSPGGGHGNPLCLENHHGQTSLAGCSPWSHKESDNTKRLSAHTA